MPASSSASTSRSVEVEPGLVDRPAPAGCTRGHATEKRYAAMPSSREEGDVVAPAVAVVGGDGRASVPSTTAPGAGGERVPDRRAATVEVDAALDLGRGGRRAPHEPVRNHTNPSGSPTP